MIAVVIVDDEVYCIDLLKELFKETSFTINVQASYTDAKSAKQFLKSSEHKIDLLFLDINMPGMNGFEMLNELRKIDFDIIFTTAYSSHAIRAFQFSAINYLLKPINLEDINSTLELWESRKRKLYPEQLEILKDTFEKVDNKQEKIALPLFNDLNIVDIDEIVRCQSENNYTHFYFTNGKHALISRTLKSVENLLAEYDFLRVHQSHLVDAKKVGSLLNREKQLYLIMQDGSEVPVSRQKRGEVRRYFQSI